MAPKDPAVVRRPLGVGDRGDDVRKLRVATIARAKKFVIPVPEWFRADGPLSKREVRYIGQIARVMGAGPKNRVAFGRGRIPRNAQGLVRTSRKRTAREIKAAKRRKPLRKRLRKRYRVSLQERAYQAAVSFIGVMEQGGNNVGKDVERIIALGGGQRGQAWCGWFMAAVYKIAGSKSVVWQWGAVRLLYPLAGIKRTTSPERGDLVRFTFDHVGMFVAYNGDGTITTIEGNTGASGAVSDSATGGDGVYRKTRSVSLVRDYLRVTR